MAATLIGAGSDYVSTSPLFALGTVQVFGHDAYTYASASAALAAADVVTLNGSYATGAGTGYTVPVAVPSGSYFWARKTTSPF